VLGPTDDLKEGPGASEMIDYRATYEIVESL